MIQNILMIKAKKAKKDVYQPISTILFVIIIRKNLRFNII